MRCLPLFFLIAVATHSFAGDYPKQITVDYDGMIIEIQVDGDLRAKPAVLIDLMGNHKSLPHFMPLVARSGLIARRADGRERIRADLHVCILFVCRNLRQVLDVTWRRGGGHADIVAHLSDFRSGRIDWQVIGAEDGPSRLRIEARFEPRRTVPTLIGSWLVERKIRREIEAGLQKLEAVADGRRGGFARPGFPERH